MSGARDVGARLHAFIGTGYSFYNVSGRIRRIWQQAQELPAFQSVFPLLTGLARIKVLAPMYTAADSELV